MALRQDRYILGDNKTIISTEFAMKVDSEFKVEIDMNKKWISWYHNNQLITTMAIFNRLLSA